MKDVHLLHVGPQAYDMKEGLGDRYHWLPPLPTREFEVLMSSVDLLLTANIAATTIAKAMVCETPVLVLQNSLAASSTKEVRAALGTHSSEGLTRWLEESTPIFPFALWPLGYHRFLAPLLRENPYVQALEVAELLDQQHVEDALRRLLFNSPARAAQLHSQASYLSVVRSLPTGAQVIQAALAA